MIAPGVLHTKWSGYRLSNIDRNLIMTVFEDLFTTLSTWAPNGNLPLDISIHFPSELAALVQISDL